MLCCKRCTGGLEVFVFVLLAVFLCVGVHVFFRCTLGMHLNRWRVKAECLLPNSGLYAFFFFFLFVACYLKLFVFLFVCMHPFLAGELRGV